MNTNLSKIKRDKMLEFLETLKNNNNDDISIRAINEIENQLKSKKYGLLWEEHEERVDKKLIKQIPIFSDISSDTIVNSDINKYNFLLEGDNLHSLKLLEKTHKGRVDFIYIDPPYNRGTNDFVYDDNMVSIEDGFIHSKWISFMEKRLRIAKRLLTQNGVMFISIDDNEYANLKLLCNEIFDEDNVETYIWCLQDKTEGSFVKTAKLTVRKEHEYILACFNNKFKFNKYLTQKEYKDGAFSNPDNDPRGDWFSGNISRNGIKSTTGSKYYTITTPTGKEYTRNWTLSKEEFDEKLKNNEIFFANGGDGVPRLKIFAAGETYSIQSSLFTDVHTSITGKNELKAIFGGESPFNFPKPTTLIKRLITIACSNKDAIILDFFAGSGTTGQAVMDLNKEDGGNRKFILCTNNEVNESDKINYLVDNGLIDPMPSKNSNKYNDWRKEFNQKCQDEEILKLLEKDEYQKMGICKSITYPRLKVVITGKRIDDSIYSDGTKTNLKHFITSWIDRNPENNYLHPQLCRHIKEMIELENMIEIDNKEYILALNKKELNERFFNIENKSKIKTIWINEEIILNEKELTELKNYHFKYVPRNYYSSELREVGE